MTSTHDAIAEKQTAPKKNRTWIAVAAFGVGIAAVFGVGEVIKNYVDDSRESHVTSMQKSISALGLEVDAETAQRVSDACRSEDWFKPTSASIIEEVNGEKTVVVLTCKDSTSVFDIAYLTSTR